MKISYEEFDNEKIPAQEQVKVMLKEHAMELKDICEKMDYPNYMLKRYTPKEAQVSYLLQTMKEQGIVINKKISNHWFWGLKELEGRTKE